MKTNEYELTVPDNASYLNVKVVRDMELSFSLQLVRVIVQYGQEKGIDAFLIDLSEVGTEDSPFEQYDYAAELKKTGLKTTQKVAMLTAPNSEEHDFVITVVRNRGYSRFRQFRDRESAISWLNQMD